MTTFEPLKLKWKDELSIILKKINGLIEDRRGKMPSLNIQYALEGSLLLISKHKRQLNLKKIEDLSIPDLERLVGTISYFKDSEENNPLKGKINLLLDKKFQKICGACLLIKLEYADTRWFDSYQLPCCDYETLYHYVIAKKRLNKLEGLKNDKRLAFILRKTYDLGKLKWFKEKYLQPNHNKWVHFIAATANLEILNKEEKKAILKHNAELKINEKQPLLAQFWNRIWLFKELGIKNIEELQNIFSAEREFLEAKKNICGFLPKTLNFEKEDLFNEGVIVIKNKYLTIKNFCNVK
jgi:hypothetical protein